MTRKNFIAIAIVQRVPVDAWASIQAERLASQEEQAPDWVLEQDEELTSIPD